MFAYSCRKIGEDTASNKFWIISVLRDGVLYPATNPRLFVSEAQAWTVARKMAAKHAAVAFVVLEATSVHILRADPDPPVTSTMLN